jgi:uncharacterized membrane protein YidH (DUF202 family)
MLPARPTARAYCPQNTEHDTRLECARPPNQQSEGLEMETHFKEKSVAGGRDDLAEERTFLVWIRTGIALMGFGFVVAHFGISADGTYLGQAGSGVPPYAHSLWFGTLLIVVGVCGLGRRIDTWPRATAIPLRARCSRRLGSGSARDRHGDLRDLSSGAAGGRHGSVSADVGH